MAKGNAIGTSKCDLCGGALNIYEGAGGTVYAKCSGACGKQSWVKSPRGVEAVRAKLGAPAAPKSPQQKPDLMADL
jgi:hypothetical protein